MGNIISVIKNLLNQIIEDIDAGNSNMTDEQCMEIMELLTFYANGNVKYSKYQACKYLGISRSTFDNLVREGKIPPGKKQQGFKEIFWTKSILDKYRSANQQ